MISHSIRKLHIGKRQQMELNGTLYSKVLSHPTELLTSGGKVKSGIQWKQLSARSRKVTEWDQRMLRHIVRTGHQLTVMLGVLQRDQLHVYIWQSDGRVWVW